MNDSRLTRYFYNPPGILKVVFNKFVWYSKTKKVLLTFDDGPNPGTTEKILYKLDEHNIKALFFLVGNNIRRYPELAREIIARGHTIGNHTYNHKVVMLKGNKVLNNEIEMFNNICLEVLNTTPKYFRPPKGRFDLFLGGRLQKRGLKNVMWSLLTLDYKNDYNICKFTVENFLKENSVIVLHDSKKSADVVVETISYIVEKVNNMGYEIGTPEECL